MTVTELADIVLYLGGLAGALVAIGSLMWVLVVRPIRKRISEQIASRVESQLETMSDRVAEVRTEMSPNNGSSMRDAINRTEIKVDALTNRFDRHLIDHPRSGQ